MTFIKEESLVFLDYILVNETVFEDHLTVLRKFSEKPLNVKVKENVAKRKLLTKALKLQGVWLTGCDKKEFEASLFIHSCKNDLIKNHIPG